MQDNQTYFINGNAEFLTFTVGGEEYAVEIMKVMEIRGYEPVTKIPNTPPFAMGVINLRGTIVPIFDLRIKFNLDAVTYDQFTVVIVLRIAGRLLGMVVDGVSEVVSLSMESILPAPKLGSSLDIRYVMGLCAIDDRMIILTDIERLLSAEDMLLFDKAVDP
jgi:purine-binding chemotaxis protein CheW